MPTQDNFTLTESLQIAALLPCVFIGLYLIIAVKDKKLTIIPVLYFISLAAGLIYGLIFTGNPSHKHLEFVLMALDGFMPALSFLLILQLTLGKIPPVMFWGILTVPTFATTPFVYASLTNPIVCTDDIDLCFSSLSALRLNKAIVASFIFMLLTFIFSRRSVELQGDKTITSHKYWLIICLIIYNVILIGIELSVAGEIITTPKYFLAKTIIKIAFIYLMMTSIFRVFSDQFLRQPAHTPASKAELSSYELSVASRAEKILKEEKIYNESGFNRASFAKKLGVREHLLSRIINMHFNKSFSELANEYRISEAKLLLASTESPVTTIAYDVGFSSITSFNRVFKEYTGNSPSEYRELNAVKNAGEQNA